MAAAVNSTGTAIAELDSRLPEAAAEDIAYVIETFVPLAAENRRHVENGVLPKATYVLPDGTAMVPADHAQLLEGPGADPDAVPARFKLRFREAGGDPAEAGRVHEEWLTGAYGACLWQTTPESIVLKGALVEAVTALLARPEPGAPAWQRTLRSAVDALDSTLRPFARYDRVRWGELSRDRLVTAVKKAYPSVWQDPRA